VTETPGRYDVGGDRPERPQIAIQQLDTKLDILSDQIGRLTEGLTALRLISEQQLEVARLQGDRLNLIDGRLDRLTAITEQQGNRLDQLTAITSTQNDRLDRIEERLDLMVGTVERQAQTAQTQQQSIQQMADLMRLLIESRGREG
jgi:methyl-accepting chemotaxis protein